MQTRSSSFRVGKRRRDPGKEAGFNVVVVVDLVSLPRAFVLLLFFLSRQPSFVFNFSLLTKSLYLDIALFLLPGFQRAYFCSDVLTV